MRAATLRDPTLSLSALIDAYSFTFGMMVLKIAIFLVMGGFLVWNLWLITSGQGTIDAISGSERGGGKSGKDSK